LTTAFFLAATLAYFAVTQLQPRRDAISAIADASPPRAATATADVEIRNADDPRADATSGPAPLPSKRTAAAPDESATTADYAAAVAAYHDRRYTDATRRLAVFRAAHPDAPEAEDASFLEASSLGYQGQTTAAAEAAKRFLGRYPRSFHARDASILVARGARERGDCPLARSVLAPWVSSRASDLISALGSCGLE
jgi:TolA-binding protein